MYEWMFFLSYVQYVKYLGHFRHFFWMYECMLFISYVQYMHMWSTWATFGTFSAWCSQWSHPRTSRPALPRSPPRHPPPAATCTGLKGQFHAILSNFSSNKRCLIPCLYSRPRINSLFHFFGMNFHKVVLLAWIPNAELKGTGWRKKIFLFHFFVFWIWQGGNIQMNLKLGKWYSYLESDPHTWKVPCAEGF